jgi:phosphoadenosine phosphosulfate reductase
MQRNGFSEAVLRADQDLAVASASWPSYARHLPGRCGAATAAFRTEDGMSIDLARINATLGHDAPALVAWALGLGRKAIVTTNFRPFEAVILHLVTRVHADVPVVWMDNGYNTEATYRYADTVTKQLKPEPAHLPAARSRAHREAVEGPRPRSTTRATPPSHEEVKLEPFARALRETAPKVWFTALRATDSAVRAQMEPGEHQPRRPDQGGAIAALVIQGLVPVLRNPRPAQQL